MITKWDDYFLHQTPRPLLETVVDTPDWIDRFYWNIQAPDGEVMFGAGLGQYRTTSRMDSIVYLLHPGEQRILRLGRQTTPEDFVDPVIGPLRFEIVEPMRRWRLRLDEDNPAGIGWDLTFTAPREPVDYRQFEFGNAEGKGSDYHHIVQHGVCEGRVALDGTSFSADRFLVSRDRSWGVRRAREGEALLLWLQHQFDDRDVCLIYVESRDGTPSYFDGAVTDADGRRPLLAVGHDLRLDPATRDVLGGVVEVRDDRGHTYRMEYRDRLLRGYVGGIGYGGWQGRDRGSHFMEAHRIDMSRPTADILAEQPMHLFAHLMRTTLNGGGEHVADLEGGITRSRRYTYRPRPLSAVDGNG
ncbi:hypothetical protein ACL02T_17400 [Pseudonocardia sp. RS010]|uniref:hypothetical protein n=1 Tax=Pseudonocardia sp. RS010 TaxID=3385979 RepID=UPI0039A086E2